MIILVTGGSGFIGSNFIRHILKKYPSYRVINLDKLTYCGNPRNLIDLKGKRNYRFVKGDIRNKACVSRLITGVDAVVNFAASTHVDRSIKDASDFIQTNVYGTFVLLNAARACGVKRFIQVSTDEVYGSCASGSCLEDSPVSPNSPYAATKAAADHLARSYYVTFGLPVVISRSSNNFGPYQYPEKVIPLFVTNAILGKKLPLYGDGQNVRDWLYVIDNCEAIDLLLHKGQSGEVYNIGAGNERTNIELTRLILRKLGKPESLVEYVPDRPGHDRRYSINCAKVRRLGWSPAHDFKEALDATVDWYIKNIDWWKRLKKS